MKNQIIYFILIFTFNQLYSQIEIPYLQDFENFQGSDELNFSILVDGRTIVQPYYYANNPDVEIIPRSNANVCNVNFTFNERPSGIIQDAFGYSWDLDSTKTNVGFCMKSTVHPNDHPYYAINTRSRSEFTVFLDSINKKTSFFKYNIYIPIDDDEFKDEVIDESQLPLQCNGDDEYEMHKILQLKSNRYFYSNNLQELIPYSFDSNKVILGMDYLHEDNLLDNKRDLYILISSPTDTTRFRRMQIRNAVIKGEWNEIIYKFYWSEIDDGNDAGYFQVWINRKPAILEPDPQPNEPSHIKFAELENIGLSPSKIFNANIVIDPNFNNTGESVPVQNLFHFGQYRRNHSLDHTIYFDNIRVTSELPPLDNYTKLIPKFYNEEVKAEDTNIKCYEVPNATEYEFEFSDTNQQVISIPNVISSNNFIDINNLDFLESFKWYKVRIKATINGVSAGFGDSGWIKTPRHTKILSEFCYDEDNPLPVENLVISCFPILNANGYHFRFKDQDGNIVGYASTTNIDTSINLNNYNFIQPWSYYKVQVRENSHDYGESCWIKTPRHTRIKDYYCDQTLSIGSYLECYELLNTNSYKFKFEKNGSVFYLDSNTNHMIIPNNYFFRSGGNYSVYARSINHNYGSGICNIYIEPQTTIDDKKIQKNIIVNSLKIYPNPFTEIITLPIFDNDVFVKVYSSTGKLVFDREISKGMDKLDLSNISNGLYYINIIHNDKIVSSKIIKNN